MCVIVVSKAKKLDKGTFSKCWESNSHGFGMAWIMNGKTHMVKGIMDLNEAWKIYNNEVRIPCVAHFRYRSSGDINRELTHPFMVSLNSPIRMGAVGDEKWLFHNGTVGDWKSILLQLSLIKNAKPKGELSDSRIIAMLLSQTGDWIFETLYPLHKWVLITPNSIMAYGDFKTKDEQLFSNLSWDNSLDTKLSSYAECFVPEWMKHDEEVSGEKPKGKGGEGRGKGKGKDGATLRGIGPLYPKYDTYRFSDND